MSCKGKGRATETATPPVLTEPRHHPSEHRSRGAEDSRLPQGQTTPHGSSEHRFRDAEDSRLPQGQTTPHGSSEHRSRDAEDSRATAPIGFDERGVMQPDTGIGSPVYRPLKIDGLDIGSKQHEINPNPGIFMGFDLHM